MVGLGRKPASRSMAGYTTLLLLVVLFAAVNHVNGCTNTFGDCDINNPNCCPGTTCQSIQLNWNDDFLSDVCVGIQTCGGPGQIGNNCGGILPGYGCCSSCDYAANRCN